MQSKSLEHAPPQVPKYDNNERRRRDDRGINNEKVLYSCLPNGIYLVGVVGEP